MPARNRCGAMEGQLRKIVGRNLRRYRVDHGFSQEASADHMACTERTWARLSAASGT